MRILFFGTADFGRPALAALVRAGHEIGAIVTQPDRPRGRSGRPQPTPVKEEARAPGPRAPVLQPERVKKRAARGDIAARGPFDLGVVAAYGQIIPLSLIELPRLGCINVHASLLPRWRGAAPIERAIEAGDEQTGVTIMRVVEALDSGPILAQRAVAIGARETAGELRARLAALGAELLIETVAALARGEACEKPQDPALVTYAPPLAKGEARIDFTLPAARISLLVRALAPDPGAFGLLLKKRDPASAPRRVEILAATPCPPPAGSAPSETQTGAPCLPPGSVAIGPRGACLVACGRAEFLALDRVKPEGRRTMSGEEWVRGRGAEPGDRFVEGPRPPGLPGAAP